MTIVMNLGPATLEDVYTGSARGISKSFQGFSGLLSNQGEKSINFYFIRVPLRKKY